MSPRFPSLAPSPPTCLLALVSPTFISPPLDIPTTTTPSNLLNKEPFPSSSHRVVVPSPSPSPLPPSPPTSPLSLDTLLVDHPLFSSNSHQPQHLVFGKDGHVVVDLVGLHVEDRTQMAELMALKSTKEACQMAAEVVGLIVPALPKKPKVNAEARALADEPQKRTVARWLHVWSNSSPSPLVVLIVTVILLERLVEIYPKMGENVISQDAPLRTAFAGFLLALKLTSEVSHVHSSFVRLTPWKLRDINAMEMQLLKCLRWDLWISSDEILHRASGFWDQEQQHQRSVLPSSPSSSSSNEPFLSSSPVTSNLFLMQRRPEVTERGWRGGLVRGAGESGSRIAREDTDPKKGDEDEVAEETTVWRRGRLERRESSDDRGRE